MLVEPKRIKLLQIRLQQEESSEEKQWKRKVDKIKILMAKHLIYSLSMFIVNDWRRKLKLKPFLLCLSTIHNNKVIDSNINKEYVK